MNRKSQIYNFHKTLRCFILIYLVLICCVAELRSQTEEYKVQYFSDEMGFTNSTIQCVIQDSQGFLWIASGEKLIRFDGKRYKPVERALDKEITSFTIDSMEQMWLGSRSGLEKIDLSTGRVTVISTPSEKIIKKIHDLYIDKNENLWIGDLGGTYRFDIAKGIWTSFPALGQTFSFSGKKTNTFLLGTEYGLQKYDHIKDSFSLFSEIKQTLIYLTFEDSKKNIWIWYFKSKDVIVFNPVQRTTKLIKNTGRVKIITEDNSQNIWIGGRKLIKVSLDLKTRSDDLKNMVDVGGSGDIEHIFFDRSSNMWISTSGRGLVKMSSGKRKFDLYRNNSVDKNSISDNVIRSITQDFSGNIWVGTENGGINIFNQNTEKFKTLDISFPVLPWSLYSSSKSSMLIGNRTNVVLNLNPLNNNIEEIVFNDINGTYSFLSDITEGPQGNIWIAGRKLFVYKTLEKQMSTRLDSLSEHWGGVQTVNTIDKSIWLGSRDLGLFVFDSDEALMSSDYSHYVYKPNDNSSLSSNNISVVHQSQLGEIWIGTYNAGLNQYDKNKNCFIRYAGLPNETIYGILDDSNGFLWISTNMGISRYDPVKQTSVNFGLEDGLQGMEYNMGSFYKASDGKMYFGGMNGLNSFYPDSIYVNSTIPKIHFTELKVLQQKLGANDELFGRKILTKEISHTQYFSLNYDENDLAISFAALDFTNPKKNQYAYKLLPNNSEWIPLGNQSEVIIANLSPGKYQLQVKGSNDDGYWNEEGKSISFEILAPWWQSYWAYAMYTIGVLSVLIGFTLWRERDLNSQKIILEDQVKKRTKSLLKAQTQLIQSDKMASLGMLTAGIAHEINNPVNFTRTSSFVLDQDLKDIKQLIEKYKEFVQKNKLDTKDIEEFEKSINYDVLLSEIDQTVADINEGTKRTSEILKGLREFSHIDQEKMELADIHQGIDNTLGLMKSKFNPKIKITKNYDRSIGLINCHLGQLNQVFLNLLLNAFDAIDTEGEIIITTSSEGDQVMISIKDNGKGIPENMVNKIFDPFFTTKKIGEGTGLGLSISHGIIKNHDGTITVKSSDENGTVFEIRLPKGLIC